VGLSFGFYLGIFLVASLGIRVEFGFCMNLSWILFWILFWVFSWNCDLACAACAINTKYTARESCISPLFGVSRWSRDLLQWSKCRLLLRILESGEVLSGRWGTPCGSMTRALKFDGLGPTPLISNQYPEGLPGLPADWQLKVDIGNELSDVTALGVEVSHRGGAAIVVENPYRSFQWSRRRIA
jgi:hypothetical protein